MRHFQVAAVNDLVARVDNVDIDRPGRIAVLTAFPAEHLLNLADIRQPAFKRQFAFNDHHRIEVGHVPVLGFHIHRRGFIDRGLIDKAGAGCGQQQILGLHQQPFPVVQVGTQAKADFHG